MHRAASGRAASAARARGARAGPLSAHNAQKASSRRSSSSDAALTWLVRAGTASSWNTRLCATSAAGWGPASSGLVVTLIIAPRRAGSSCVCMASTKPEEEATIAAMAPCSADCAMSVSAPAAGWPAGEAESLCTSRHAAGSIASSSRRSTGPKRPLSWPLSSLLEPLGPPVPAASACFCTGSSLAPSRRAQASSKRRRASTHRSENSRRSPAAANIKAGSSCSIPATTARQSVQRATPSCKGSKKRRSQRQITSCWPLEGEGGHRHSARSSARDRKTVRNRRAPTCSLLATAALCCSERLADTRSRCSRAARARATASTLPLRLAPSKSISPAPAPAACRGLAADEPTHRFVSSAILTPRHHICACRTACCPL
eukprot:scaffold100963_cov69-Phaeocystis_antarctica.AAC.3